MGSASSSPHAAPATPDVSVINTQWTLRLRLGSLLGQLATVVVVYFGMGIVIPLLPLVALLAIGLLSNLACQLHLRRHRDQPVGRTLLPLLMGLDVVHLTAMLYLTGGPMNPFSIMYLVLIALATVVLPPRATWGLVALSVAGFAVLYFWHRPLDLHGHGQGGGHRHGDGDDPMRIHLYGMWVACSIAASFIVYFLLRIRRALAQREAELEAARSLSARRDKLASLATLAAGAAHELATPLSTIAIAAKELERQLAAGRADAAALDDVQLIRAQVARCRSVLDQLAREAGDSTGESLLEVTPAAVLAAAEEGLADPARLRILCEDAAAQQRMRLPLRSLAQALRALLKNALEASPADTVVEVRVTLDAGALRIEVADRGSGMSPEVLRRLGEPFFTTKAPGSGMGLGVFLCRAVFESLGGQLTFTSQSGHGTRAVVHLPMATAPRQQPALSPLAA
jgi:two-component system sensor histidine kinase RegB